MHAIAASYGFDDASISDAATGAEAILALARAFDPQRLRGRAVTVSAILEKLG